MSIWYLCGSWIRTHNVLEPESPPITTWPGIEHTKDFKTLVGWFDTNHNMKSVLGV